MTTRIIYLIQSASGRIPYAIPEHSSVLLLQWSDAFEEGPNTIHLPGSSWAQGRNELYRAASQDGYDYYVFLDDDVQIDFALESFEELLTEHRPRRLVPWLNHAWNTECLADIDRVKYVDHIFMALRADCASELLPYTTEFDTTNWWLASEDMCERFWRSWPLETYRANGLSIDNLEHRDYPKADYPGLPTNVVRPLNRRTDSA